MLNSVRLQSDILIAKYNGQPSTDYTDLAATTCKIVITTYEDILDICKMQTKCEFCEDSDDPVEKLIFSHGGFNEECIGGNGEEKECSRVSGEIEDSGKVNNLYVDTANYDIITLLYGDDYSIKGIINGQNDEWQIVNWPIDSEMIILGESILTAAYDYGDNSLYYIDKTNTLINFKNGINNPLCEFPRNITIGSIDIFKSSLIIMVLINDQTLDIFRITLPVSTDQNYEDVFSDPMSIISIGDIKNKDARILLKITESAIIYISYGNYLVKIDESIEICNMQNKIISYAVDIAGDVYFSSENSKNVGRMNLKQFCEVDPFTDNIFPDPPLLVKYTLVEELKTSNNGLPFWFAYAVGGGGGLLLLLLIILIGCICYKCKKAKRTVAPALPPGYAGLTYEGKHDDEEEFYTDLENFEPSQTMKQRIKTESVYVDLVAPSLPSSPNPGPETSEPDYENNLAVSKHSVAKEIQDM